MKHKRNTFIKGLLAALVVGQTIVAQAIAPPPELVILPVFPPQPIVAGPDGYAEVTLSVENDWYFPNVVWKENGIRIGEGPIITVRLYIGTHQIVVVGKDPNGNVIRDEETVVVEPYKEPINSAPYFQGKPVLSAKARVNKAFELDMYSTAIDEDGDELTFSIVKGPNWLDITPDGILYGTPKRKDRGINKFKVKVEDGRGGSAVGLIKVRVK